MVRIKMPLKLIKDERHRNSTFMKRREVIKKKAMELGKLCDITTLLVCFGPRGQLETWPEDPRDVRRIIDHYSSLRPEDCVRRYDIATFFEAQIKRLQAELSRHRDAWLDRLPADDSSLEDLARSLDAKLAAIDDRIVRLRLEEDSRGKGGIEVWSHPQHTQSQQQMLEVEEMPPASGALSALPFDTILDARPIQSFAGVELPEVKREDYKFSENGLHGHAAAAAAAAAASVWGAPHDHLSLEMPCGLPHWSPDPYTLPMVADHGFNMDLMTYLDDPIISNPFLPIDFSTYTSGVGNCTSSMVDVLNPAMGFPLPLTYDTSLASSGVPQFEHPVLDAGYNFSLHHLPEVGNPAMVCNEVYHQNQMYGADDEFKDANIARSVAEAWSSSSIFHDLLPPNGCSCSSCNSVQALAPGGVDDPSKSLPSSATNPYA